MGESNFWRHYLAEQARPYLSDGNFGVCEQAFIQQKQNIAELVHRLSPTSVAILGAGYLNDIPLTDLLAAGRQVYLVDWLEDAPVVGVSRLLLQQDEEDAQYRCLFCDMRTGKDYCKKFSGEYLAEGVCTAFLPSTVPYLTCENYEPSDEPRFIRADITGGIARSFAANIEEQLLFCSTPREALLQANSYVERYQYRPLPIEDDSVELVTSSMVLSHFDFEPYNYFVALLEDRFGRKQLQAQEAELNAHMEELRTRLFTLQVDAHAREIYRIVKKDNQARVYLSAELFRSYPNSKHSFVVRDMPGVLEILDKYFLFAFEEETDGKVLSKSVLGDGTSINQCYRLVARTWT